MSKKPHIPAPTGTEDKEQLRALGEYFARHGTQGPRPVPQPPGFTWGFTPEERARLEEAAARRERENKAPKGPTPRP